jgi:hypothetical protein
VNGRVGRVSRKSREKNNKKWLGHLSSIGYWSRPEQFVLSGCPNQEIEQFIFKDLKIEICSYFGIIWGAPWPGPLSNIGCWSRPVKYFIRGCHFFFSGCPNKRIG